MLRWYCLTPASEPRSLSARAALYGSSEGRWISRLELALRWASVTRSEMRLRSDSVLRWTMPVVMRMARDPLLRVRRSARAVVSSPSP